MKRSKNFKKNAVLIIAITIFLSLVLPLQAAEPLGIAPENTLIYAQINNLDDALGRTDQFLSGALPIPIQTQMLIRMQLANIFGNPSLAGIDTKGIFSIFVSEPEGANISEDSITILIPVVDYKEFVKSSTNLSAAGNNGVSEIKSIGGYVTNLGNYAVLKPPHALESLLSFKKSASKNKTLSDVISAGQKKEASNASLWVYCNMPLVNKTFGQQISFAMQMMKESMDQEMQEEMPNAPLQFGKILSLYADIINAVLTQSKSYTLALTPSANVFRLRETLEAIDGTEIDRLLSPPAVKGRRNLAGFLEGGAALNVVGSGLGKWNAEMLKCVAEAFATDQNPENIAKIRKMADDMSKVLNGSSATTFSIDAESKPPFVGKYVIEVSDEKKFYTLTDQAMEIFKTSGLTDFYKSLGIDMSFSMKRGVDNYKGIPIDSFLLSLKMVDTSTNDMKEAAQAIEMMYGEGIEYRLALVDGLCAYTFGGNADENLKKLIDKIQAGGDGEIPAEFKQAMSLLEGSEDADFLLTFNIVRIFDIMPAMAGMFGPEAAESMPEVNFQTSSNAVAAGHIGNGKFIVDFALPKQHLMEMMQIVQMFMMMGQPQQQ